jgi:hypothetical protein
MFAIAFDLVVADTMRHHPKSVPQAYADIGGALAGFGFERDFDVAVSGVGAARQDQGVRQVRRAAAPNPPRSSGNVAGLPLAHGPERRYRADRDMGTRPLSRAVATSTGRGTGEKTASWG